MTIGKKIAELRNQRGWTTRQLAEKVGVSHSSISQYEADESIPRRKVVNELSRIFGVKPEYWNSNGLAMERIGITKTDLKNMFLQIESLPAESQATIFNVISCFVEKEKMSTSIKNLKNLS